MEEDLEIEIPYRHHVYQRLKESTRKDSSRPWTVDDHRMALTMPRNVSEELLSIGGPESVVNSGRTISFI